MTEELIFEFERHCRAYTPISVNTRSTNIYSLEHIDSLLDNIVVIAPMQEGGKGRDGKIFVSKAGGAYFSIVSKIRRLTLAKIMRFVYAAGLAVGAMLGEYGVKSGLKWPNDVLVDSRKICGILCESVTDACGRTSVIVGIGVNIHNDINEICGATKLGEHATNRVSIPRIIARTVYFYDKLLKLSAQRLLKRYKKDCITIGKEVVIAATGETGEAVGISAQGFLEVKIKDVIIEVKAGEVRLKESLC